MFFKLKITFFFAILSLGAAFGSAAQDADSLQAVLRFNVECVTDSIFRGRAFGDPATVVLRNQIARGFSRDGLRPLKDGYIHSFSQDGKVGHNVVGIIPPAKGNKYILVSASADGLGTIAGICYPGADSNGSGLAALLSLPSLVRREDAGFIFVAFDGRIAGMAGSNAFWSDLQAGKIVLEDGKPLKPSQIGLMTSLDILGSTLVPFRSYWPDYLIALGGSRYETSILTANMYLWLHVEYDYYGSRDFTNLFYRRIGDQRVFLEHGIPAVVWTSGITMNTNKPTDTSATLDYPVFAERVTLIAKWLNIQAYLL